MSAETAGFLYLALLKNDKNCVIIMYDFITKRGVETMDREDLLDFNFDWRDEATFKKALKESNLPEKEKLRLRDERMRRLELEELKSAGSDYDDYEYDNDDEEEVEEKPEETKEEADKAPEKESGKDNEKKSAGEKKKKDKKKDSGDDGVIVAIKGSYPIRKMFVAMAMCIILAIMPYISYYHAQPLTDLTAKYLSSDSGYIIDWFLFQKEFTVVITAVMLILIFIVEEFFIEKRWKDIPLKKKNLRLPLILTGVYAGFLIASDICAEHKELVMMGIAKHYEGLLGVLGYLVIFIAAMNYFCDTKSLERFSWAMVLTAFAASVFAVMEYKGHAFQESDLMAHLMAPPEKYDLASTLSSNSENVHITFFNSNYFGSFCGLMFPITAAIGLGSKNILRKVIGLLAAAGIAVGAVLSNSSGGLYSVAGCGALLVLIYIVYWFRGKIDRVKSLIAFLCAGAVFAGGFVYLLKTNEDFAARFNNVVSNGSSIDSVVVRNEQTIEEQREQMAYYYYLLKDIRQIDNGLELDDYRGNTLRIENYITDSGSMDVRFYDTDGAELETYIDDDKNYCFADERYENCEVKYSSTDKLYIDLGYRKKLIFQYEEGKFKPFVHNMYTQEKINTYQGPEFFKKDLSAFTGRYLIWGTTISFLDECIILGKGSGHFITVYPQYDYVSLLEVYGTPGMVVNKPHNWYLGVAVDSGLISLAALLALLGAFLIKGLKTVIIHPIDDRFKHLRLGIYVSVIAFMVVGIVNDSYVCVSPVFWFIFGVGWYAVSGNKVVETD